MQRGVGGAGLDPRARDKDTFDRSREVDIKLLRDRDGIELVELLGVPSFVFPRVISPMKPENPFIRPFGDLAMEGVAEAVWRADEETRRQVIGEPDARQSGRRVRVLNREVQ